MKHLYVIFASYVGRERINGTVPVLFKSRFRYDASNLIFSHINGRNVSSYCAIPTESS